MDFPNPDYVALARACGGTVSRPRSPASCAKPSARRFDVDGPAIVDAVVVPNELPNVPHFDLETIGNFARAKIKEAIIAVTGS